MRERLCKVIYGQSMKERSSVYYDWFIMAVAIASVVPMMFRGGMSYWMKLLESVTVYILFFDYILRWMTHDFRMKNHSIWAFFIYPFTPLALGYRGNTPDRWTFAAELYDFKGAEACKAGAVFAKLQACCKRV